MRVKAKKDVMFDYGKLYKAYISVRVNQIWEVNATRKDGSVWIARSGITINIKKDDFEKYFTPLKET